MVLTKKIFEYISMFFYGSNLGPPARGHLEPWNFGLNKLGKGPPGNAIYQISSPRAKQFWRRRFFKYISFLNPRPPPPPPQGHFGPQGHHLNKLGRGPLGNATYQISRPKAKWFQRRCCLKKIVDDARRTTDNARRTLANGNSSP